jgi:putative acetyltransferase
MQKTTREISIISYEPIYRSHFESLNRAWLTQNFFVTEVDESQFKNPGAEILDFGGQVFFLLEDGTPVGTCATIPLDDNCYELCKLAVASTARGRHYGERLIKAALKWSKANGGTQITLLSNTKLEAANALFIKCGFLVMQVGPIEGEERFDVEMAVAL